MSNSRLANRPSRRYGRCHTVAREIFRAPLRKLNAEGKNVRSKVDKKHWQLVKMMYCGKDGYARGNGKFHLNSGAQLNLFLSCEF